MTDLTDVKKFIENNRSEVNAILESERLEIVNNPKLKILQNQYLFDFWHARPNKKFIFIIFFQEKLVDKLDYDSIANSLSNEITESLKCFNVLHVDENFRVIEKFSQKIEEKKILELSNNSSVAYVFGEEGIEIGVRGFIFNKSNLFYNEIDREKYLRKYHISELQNCLLEYEKTLTNPGLNSLFFSSRATVERIEADCKYRNILVNKPEKYFRDNLLLFLNEHTQHKFIKENELPSREELDLYTEADGKNYLIEIKWLGRSINDDETGFSQPLTDYHAREGVVQALNYIKELIEKMNFTLHCGFLCVFDARDIKKDINYRDFKFIEDKPDLVPYYLNHFIKLREISIDNIEIVKTKTT